jgi:hypothetical protein
MKRTAVTRVTLPHRHADRGPWDSGQLDPAPVHYPGCGALLRVNPAGSAEFDRLVGTCPATQCGEVVVYRVCERRLIVADRRKPAPRR